MKLIKSRETPILNHYTYTTNTHYTIDVTTIGSDTHITALPPEEYKFIVPQILFITSDSGNFVFPDRIISPQNVDMFFALLDEASQIYKMIQQYFIQLANGHNFFDDKENIVCSLNCIEYTMEN